LCDIIKTTTGNTLAYALNSLDALMEHETGWETLDEEFVRTIISIDVSQTLVTVCRPATAILIKLVNADKQSGSPISCYGYNFLHSSAKDEAEFLPTLVQRLQSPDYLLCLNSLDLITTMIKHVTDEHLDDLSEQLQKLNAKRYVLVSTGRISLSEN
jgi:engulfment/cell motility protein 1